MKRALILIVILVAVLAAQQPTHLGLGGGGGGGGGALPAGGTGAIQSQATAATFTGDNTLSYQNLVAIAAPAQPGVITHGGTPATTAYSYTLVGITRLGWTVQSTARSTATGAATLTGTDTNIIPYVCPSTTYISCDVLRTATSGTPASTGRIGNVTGTGNFTDTGIVADSGTILDFMVDFSTGARFNNLVVGPQLGSNIWSGQGVPPAATLTALGAVDLTLTAQILVTKDAYADLNFVAYNSAAALPNRLIWDISEGVGSFGDDGTITGEYFALYSGVEAKNKVVLQRSTFTLPSDMTLQYSSTTDAFGSADGGLSRLGAAAFALGNGTNGNASASLKMALVNSAGAAPSVNNASCSGSTIGAGATEMAGTLTGSPTGTCTVVLTFAHTATTGWVCAISNRTTANLIRQTAASTTTATFVGVTVSGDVLQYGPCMAY